MLKTKYKDLHGVGIYYWMNMSFGKTFFESKVIDKIKVPRKGRIFGVYSNSKKLILEFYNDRFGEYDRIITNINDNCIYENYNSLKKDHEKDLEILKPAYIAIERMRSEVKKCTKKYYKNTIKNWIEKCNEEK